jgi:hypothetical protein
MPELESFSERPVKVFRANNGRMQSEIGVSASGGFVVKLFYLSDALGYPTANLIASSHVDTMERAMSVAAEGIADT